MSTNINLKLHSNLSFLEYNDVLDVDFDPTAMTCTISNSSPLDTTTKIITTNLYVQLDEETVASTVIIINLTPKENEVKFKRTYYTGNYTEDNEIILEEPISLDGLKDGDSVSFTFDGNYIQIIFTHFYYLL